MGVTAAESVAMETLFKLTGGKKVPKRQGGRTGRGGVDGRTDVG